MCSTESELFFLITRFLESKPELRDYAEQLRQQLQLIGALGPVVSWDGTRRQLRIEDIERLHHDLPKDQLVRLVKLPSGGGKTATLLRRLSGIYRYWDSSVREQCAQLTRRMSDELRRLHESVCRARLCRQSKLLLAQNLDISRAANNHIASTISLIDESTDLPVLLTEYGRNREVARLDTEIDECNKAAEAHSAAIVHVKSALAENGLLLSGIHRGRLDSGYDWLHARALGVVGRAAVANGGLSKALQLSAAQMRTQMCLRYQILWTVSGHMLNPAYCSVFDRTGRFLLTGADDYLVKIWDVHEGLLVQTCRGHDQYISYIAVSPDNAIFASGCTRGTIRIWRLRDGMCLQVMNHGATVNWLKFDSCTGALASVSDDGQCVVWDLSKSISKGQLESPLFTQAEQIKYGDNEVSQGRQVTLSSTSSSSPSSEEMEGGRGLFAWSRADEENPSPPTPPTCMLSLPHIHDSALAPAQDASKVLCLDVSTMGRILVTGCEDGVARVWRFDQDRHRYDIRELRRGWESLPTARNSMPPSEFAKLERVAHHLLLRLEGHVCPVTDIQLNSAGDRVLTGSALDGSVRIWSLSRDYSRSIHIILDLNEEDHEATVVAPVRQRGRQAASRSRSKILVYNACWTIDDLRVVTIQSVPSASDSTGGAGNGDSTQATRLKVWDAMNGDLLRVIRNISNAASQCLVPHPLNASIVVTAGDDGFVNVWDIDLEQRVSQNRVLREENQPAAIIDVSIASDGTFIAATDVIGRVTLLGLDDPSRYGRTRASYPEQYFSSDYASFILDELGYAIDVGTQLPVNTSPVGLLCNINGTAYEVQPPRLLGPGVIPVAEVRAKLLEIEENRASLPREMERVFTTFSRNKARGREPRKYKNGEQPQGFRAVPQPAKVKARKAKATKTQYIEFDINQYQPSSEEDPDSDWEQRRRRSPSEDEEEGVRSAGRSSARGHRSRNVRSLSDYSSRSVRRSGRSRNASINYDYGEVDHPDSRALRSYTRSGRRLRSFEDSDIDEEDEEDDDEDDDELEDELDDEDSCITSESDNGLMDNSSDDEARRAQRATRLLRTRSTRSSTQQKEHRDRKREKARRVARSSSSAPSARKARQPRHTPSRPALTWTLGTTGIRTVPIDHTVDRAWLQLDYQNEALYCPQLGDRVVYFPQGHRVHLSDFPNDMSPPWLAFPIRWPFVECEVRHLRYDFPTAQEHRWCQSVVAVLTLAVVRIPVRHAISANGHYLTDLAEPRVSRHSGSREHVFQVMVRNCNLADFLVPISIFQRAVHLPWHQGVKISVSYKETDEESREMVFRQYTGKVLRLSNADEEWPHSPWEALEITWDDAVADGTALSFSGQSPSAAAMSVDRVCPWEANPLYEHGSSSSSSSSHAHLQAQFQLPCLDAAEAHRIDQAIEQLMTQRSADFDPFLYPVDSSVFPDYYCIVPNPVYIDLIRLRLRNQYYRQLQALEFDIEQLLRNCELYNSPTSDIVRVAQELRDSLVAIVHGQPLPTTEAYSRSIDHAPSEESPLPSEAKRGKRETHSRSTRSRPSRVLRSQVDSSDERNGDGGQREEEEEREEKVVLRSRRKRERSPSPPSEPVSEAEAKEESEAEKMSSQFVPVLRLRRSIRASQPAQPEEPLQRISTRLSRQADSLTLVLPGRLKRPRRDSSAPTPVSSTLASSQSSRHLRSSRSNRPSHSNAESGEEEDEDEEAGDDEEDDDEEEDEEGDEETEEEDAEDDQPVRKPSTRQQVRQSASSKRSSARGAKTDKRRELVSSDDEDGDSSHIASDDDEDSDNHSELSDQRSTRRSTRAGTSHRLAESASVRTRQGGRRAAAERPASQKAWWHEQESEASPSPVRRQHGSASGATDSLISPLLRASARSSGRLLRSGNEEAAAVEQGSSRRRGHEDSLSSSRSARNAQDAEGERRGKVSPAGQHGLSQSSSQPSGGRIHPETKKHMLEVLAGAESLDEKLHIFALPVDSSAPGYYDLISEPVDLSTIRDRISHRQYSTVQQVVDDVLKMYDNCELYNMEDSIYSKEARRQRKKFLQFTSQLPFL